jgi:hypothetical protein
MNVALWIVAGLLAVGSLAGGVKKLIQPKEKLAASGWGWVEDFTAGTVKAIGALEILAAAGLILPAALGIAPVLVPLAATGAVLLFAGAAIKRLRRRERARSSATWFISPWPPWWRGDASARGHTPGLPSRAR